MFWNLHVATGAPILVGLAAGEAAARAAELGREEVVQKAVSRLRAMFPKADVPEPVNSHVTDWVGDPYARGVYSYHAVGCTGSEYDDLAAPVGSTLLFAGEHTCKEHPDTIGGAMLSGLREAARILRVYLHPRAVADAP